MNSNSSLAYIPGLDLLRAFAIFLVLLSHFLPEDWPLYHLFPYGSAGVFLFFVLSGYLITRILLVERTAHQSLWSYLKRFYWRRTLRIFPIYYLCIFLALLFDAPGITEAFWWLLTYTANLYFSLQGSFEVPLGHFWTLAVEEQFYLVWPIIVFGTPRKYLRKVLWAGVILSPLFRIFALSFGWNRIASLTLLPGCTEMLCFGALLAEGEVHRHSESMLRRFKSLGLSLGLPATVLLQIHYLFGAPFLLLEAFRFTALSFFLLWVLASLKDFPLSTERRGVQALLFLGKISYGMYVYHNFVRAFLLPSIETWELSEGFGILARLILLGGTTFLVATISWFVLERPLLRLKNAFTG